MNKWMDEEMSSERLSKKFSSFKNKKHKNQEKNVFLLIQKNCSTVDVSDGNTMADIRI